MTVTARPPPQARCGHRHRQLAVRQLWSGRAARHPQHPKLFQFLFWLSGRSHPCPALTGLCHPIGHQPWVQGELRLLQRQRNPHLQRTQGPRHRPNTAAPCSLPTAPRDCTSGSVRGRGAELPHTGAQTPPFSCRAPSQHKTSPGGSSEAPFPPSSWTLLLLPGSLGRRRHRAHSQCCSLRPAARMSPQAAYSQADASGFSLRFGALPQTARAKRGKVSGRGRGGKGAACPQPVL